MSEENCVLNSHTNDGTMADVGENVSNNVKVIVRVRPPNDLELNGQRKNVVEIMNKNILVFDPKEESSPFPGRHGRRRHRDIRKRRQKDLKFAFDYVFGWTSNNMEVFEHSTRTVLDGLLGGYNCSVFAYGATGAGKTHTMLGNESNPGVIYHTMIHLYRQIAEMSSEKTCDVAVSYLEVYNEQIHDLLMVRGTLPIREDHNAGVIVPGLSLHKPRNAEELLHMLQFGNKNRTQHPTDANAESSRSHAVFQVFVRQRDRTANLSAQVKVAKMCLVDLAGSERATVTKNRGARFREGANINRSLLALGNVINSLADHKFKGHIPYRDSKLTRLLKDSLGGNCRTIMIAAVSPSDLSYEDTYNTLKYADRAKNIRLNMKKNVFSVDFHVSRYGQIVEELRREITELKSKLQQCERPVINLAQSVCLPSDLQSLHESLQMAYSERRALRDQQLQQEISMRNTQWRLYRKHKCLRRASQLNHGHPESLLKIQGVVEGLQRKVLGQEAERQALCQQLQNNTQALHTLQSKAAVTDSNASLYSQVLEMSVQKMALEVELNDSHHYIRHLRCLARAQEQEAVASETLISALLQLVQQQHLELQRHGPLVHDIAVGYRSVCELVGQWGVSWADGERDSDQGVFHINSIIDIPLVTSAGAVLNRVPSPGHPSTGTTAHSGQNTNTKSVISCPGRMVNGKAVFSTNPASVVSPQPVIGLLTSAPHSNQLVTSHCPTSTPLVASSSSSLCVAGTDDRTSPAPPAKPVAMSTEMLQNSTGCRGHLDSGDHDSRPSDSFTTTIYAGHTPNPKKLAHRTESRHEENLSLASVSALSSSASVPASVNPWNRLTGAVSGLSSPAPRLNETFSLEGSVASSKNSADNLNSTVILDGTSQLCVPVIDGSLSSCMETSSSCTQGVSSTHRDHSNSVQSDNSSHSHHHHPQLTPASGSVVVSSCQQSVKGAGNPYSTQDIHVPTAVTQDRPRVKNQAPGSKVSPQNDENAEPHQKLHSNVRRAIIFDGPASDTTPIRVEGKSYADAVRTPTPPRQPLQTLDCNSPQLQATSLLAGQPQTPKSSGHASLYIIGPQALDNVRRLKQLGMPSLVENLVIGHKAGGPKVSKPGYMQPTQATARRVHLQTVSKDDCFNPRRVQNKRLAHSRSKSTSQLNKIGWKV